MSQASHGNVFKTAALNHSATLPSESSVAVTIENAIVFWRRWLPERRQSNRTYRTHKQLIVWQSVTKSVTKILGVSPSVLGGAA